MTSDLQSKDSTTVIQVARDTAVSEGVFRVRTETDDGERLLEIARDHAD